MEQLSMKPYEISIWKDKLIDGENPYYKELMLAKIGSNEASSPNECFNITLNKNVNGEIKLNFSMLHQYYDENIGEKIQNPFIPYLVNERKVKLKYDNKWYDFIIKKVEEDSDSDIFSYECTDLFVNELSKGGYNVSLSTDLANNQGTIVDLAKTVMQDTDWQVLTTEDEDGSDVIRAYVQEPLYKGVLNQNINTLKAEAPTETVTINSGELVYFFYSEISNKKTKDVHILRAADRDSDDKELKWVFDDNNVVKGPNYRIVTNFTYIEGTDRPSIIYETYTGPQETEPVTWGVNLEFQGYRLNYGPISKWDPLTEKYVDIYKANDREIYHYTDHEYTTSDILTNYITNGHNFNLLTEGDIMGWDTVTTHTGEGVDPPVDQIVGLSPYPYTDLKDSITLGELDRVKNYLKVHFNGKMTSSYQNTVFNSGVQDNADLINGFAKGEPYIFRVKYGTTTKDNPDGQGGAPTADETQHLKVLIAAYTINENNLRVIDTSRIYFYVDGEENEEEGEIPVYGPLDNVVSGGEIDNEKRVYRVKNEYGYDIYTPSTDKIYDVEEGGSTVSYKWDPAALGQDGEEGQFITLDGNELHYYYYIMKCRQSLSNKDLMESDIGIFLYTDKPNGEVGSADGRSFYWIDDIQIFKYRVDGDGQPMMIGNIPTATSIETDYYYLVDEDVVDGDKVEKYYTLDALKEAVGITGDVEQVYNEACEKISSIEAEHSNYFNIIQDLCEQFQCWAEFTVEHEDNGEIKLDENHNPIKKIAFHEYVGKDNFAGFKYGINLSSIQRTFSSDEIVSKLIVANNSSDFVDGGLTIRRATSNTFGEDYILNFAYYLNQGLIDREKFYEDLDEYRTRLSTLNNDLETKESKYEDLVNKARNIGAEKTTYGEYVKAAQIDLIKSKQLIKQITGKDYELFIKDFGSSLKMTIIPTKKTGSTITRAAKVELSMNNTKVSIDGLQVTGEQGNEIYPKQNGGIVYYDSSQGQVPGNHLSVLIPSPPDGYDRPLRRNSDGSYSKIVSDEEPHFFINDPQVFTPNTNPNENGVYCILPLASDNNDTLIDTIGRIIADQTVINGYTGTVSDLTAEYNKLITEAEGKRSYTVTIKLDTDRTQVIINDFVDGLEMTFEDTSGQETAEWVVTSSAIDKIFEWNYTANQVTIDEILDGYDFIDKDGNKITKGTTIQLNPVDAIYTYFLKPTNEVSNLKDEIDGLLEEKKEVEKNFYKKYSRFIQEGTWTSDDHVDNELYYLDALQVSNTSALPKVEYTIKVLEISELEGLENYIFDVGDKTYMEDTEFFGWTYPNSIKTPVREEVIISEVTWHLDQPEENEIVVKNYKTRFEDLFQRIAASTQTVEYNNGSYMRAASALDTNGLINSDLLSSSLSNIGGGGFLLSADGKVEADMYGITVTDLANPANKVRLGGKGLMVSEDGGQNWDIALTPQGIDIKYIRAGAIDAGKITIMDGDQPSFRWDSTGINAFSFDEENPDEYDYSKFVRFDKFGLYGVEGIDGLTNFAPTSLGDIKDKASFGAVWNEFFIKSKYENGYSSMSSTDDFTVVRYNDNDEEVQVVKVGKVEESEETGESIYGITVRDKEGNLAFEANSEGDVTLSGTLQSNNYSPNLSGWKIDKAGDAEFNSIQVRGSIHAAVFEYDEVQAIGGLVYIRPSTAIVTAESDGRDLILTVENPAVISSDNFCRISTELDNGIINDVYDYSYSNKIITITNYFPENISEVDKLDELAHLVGAAFISLGSYNSLTGETTNNFAISLNSSKSNLAMPAKAITLSEINRVDTGGSLTINSNFRGIFGQLPANGVNVDSSIYQYMAGTQGVYTDNIYIGDTNKYIAFYTDTSTSPSTRKLAIKADLITFSGAESGTDLSDTIVKQEIQYARADSTSPTRHIDTSIGTNGWSTTMPTSTENYPYIWQRTYVKKISGTVSYVPNNTGFYVETTEGQPGIPGYNTATIFLYQRSATAPSSSPSGGQTYTFSTGTLSSVPTGWSTSIPSGDEPCYLTQTAVRSQDNTTTIASWSTPVKLVEDGERGEEGTKIIGTFNRNSWTNNQWTSTYGIGQNISLTPNNTGSSGGTSPSWYDYTKVNVGDYIYITGTATDTGIAYTNVCQVTTKPSTSTSDIPCYIIASNHSDRGMPGEPGAPGPEASVEILVTNIDALSGSIELKAILHSETIPTNVSYAWYAGESSSILSTSQSYTTNNLDTTYSCDVTWS